jgi:catechol 2,3-dioxygenase-like lactoylglutathione lyase family enzyme
MATCYTQHIDHYVTAMQDIDRAKSFYIDLLGGTLNREAYKFSPEMDPMGTRPPTLSVRLGTVELDLFGDELFGLPYRKNNRGIPRYAYAVATEDFPKVVERLRAAGYKFDGPDSDAGDDASHVWLHDPDGNFVELVDRGRPKRRPQDEIEIFGIDHVEYESLDINASSDFYRSALGLEEGKRGRSPEGNPFVDLMVPTSGQYIRFHLVERLSQQATQPFRGTHLAFFVPKDEFASACEQLEVNGVLHGDYRGDMVHRDYRLVQRANEGDGSSDGTYFRDPTGYKIQFIAKAGGYADEMPKRNGHPK